MTQRGLLPLDAALELLHAAAPAALERETIGLDGALGRILAQDVVAGRDLPSFDNSAVDGYAVRAAEAIAGAFLSIAGESFAGSPFDGTLAEGQAVRIATGAMLPVGADAVVMQEVCESTAHSVVIGDAPAVGANCRRAGQDLVSGTPVLRPGRVLGGPEIALLAALGTTTLSVGRRLKVALASTGSELVEEGSLHSGQIYDSNRPLLRSLLARYPVDIVDLGILPDEKAQTRARLMQAAGEAHLILTSGGISVGTRDYVRDTIEEDGRKLFWRLAIKPGKPLLYGTLSDTPIIALPGNPVSSYVTFQLACRPLLFRLLGAACPPPLRFPVCAGFAYRKSPALREFVRVRVADHDGTMVATPFRSQLSNLISSLLESDGLLDLPAGRDGIEPGETFEFLPWTSFTTPA